MAERASSLNKTEWWGAGMVICLGRGADLHMAQLMLLPLTVSCSSKSRLSVADFDFDFNCIFICCTECHNHYIDNLLNVSVTFVPRAASA